MLTQSDRDRFKIHYTNRFRNRSFEGKLETTADDTKEIYQLTRRIDNLKAEVNEVVAERHIAEKAFQAVLREQQVKHRKDKLNVPADIDVLLTEVYARAQQCTKLMGAQYSDRHELPDAYAELRNYVVDGVFHDFRWSSEPRTWNPVFVIKSLLGSASKMMWHDNTKKGMPLANRVNAASRKAWKIWSDDKIGPYLKETSNG